MQQIAVFDLTDTVKEVPQLGDAPLSRVSLDVTGTFLSSHSGSRTILTVESWRMVVVVVTRSTMAAVRRLVVMWWWLGSIVIIVGTIGSMRMCLVLAIVIAIGIVAIWRWLLSSVERE